MLQIIFAFTLFFQPVSETTSLNAATIIDCGKKDLAACEEMLFKCGYKKSEDKIVQGDVDGPSYSYWNNRPENFSIHFKGEKISQLIFDKKDKDVALKLMEEFKVLGFKITENQTTATRIKEEYEWGKLKLTFKQLGKTYDFNITFR